MADLFLGDDLFGVDRSLPLSQRVEAAKKRVAKERAQSTLASAARGQTGGGGEGRKSGGRGREEGASSSSRINRGSSKISSSRISSSSIGDIIPIRLEEVLEVVWVVV